MKTLSTILNAFRFGPTATGLDLLQNHSIASTIADELVRTGNTPASLTDIEQAFHRITGSHPTEHELYDAKAFLLSFGLLQV